MPNPLVDQGTLNRLLGSIVVPNNSTLNITASFLARAGISLTLQGESVTYFPTMTGQVTSPEPYMAVEVTAALLKSQPLSNLYKRQMETNALIGPIVVRPDATTLGVYQFSNCSIKSVHQLSFNGENADFMVVLGGYYLINSTMWG